MGQFIYWFFLFFLPPPPPIFLFLFPSSLCKNKKQKQFLTSRSSQSKQEDRREKWYSEDKLELFGESAEECLQLPGRSSCQESLLEEGDVWAVVKAEFGWGRGRPSRQIGEHGGVKNAWRFQWLRIMREGWSDGCMQGACLLSKCWTTFLVFELYFDDNGTD